MGYQPEESTIAGYHKALNNKEISCEETVRYYLDRIEKYDKGKFPLNAIISVNKNALNEAKKLDEKISMGFIAEGLFGVPVLVKDNIETFDMPTTAGSKSLEGWQTHRDSFIVKKLRDSGAIILAKTNLHEFAIWGETVSSVLGQTYNPYDYTRTPGGSSGGTGAGLAADFAMAGLGTDTINSIRSPASACCLCGIRPTLGLVSRSGIVPYSLTQDTAGPLARTVEDAVRVLDVIAGYDQEDALTQAVEDKKAFKYCDFLQPDGLKGKKLGILRSFMGREIENQEVNRIMEDSFSIMRNNGALLVDIEEGFDSSFLVKEVSLHIHDLKADLEGYLESFGDKAPVRSIKEILKSKKHSPDILEQLKYADTLDINAGYYKNRILMKTKLREEINEIMDAYGLDAIIYPHQQQLVCKAGGSQKQRNGVIGSITGFPAIVVPAGFSEAGSDAPIGVPIGLEILGRAFDEGILIEIAYGFESVSKKRKPPILKEDVFASLPL